MKLRVVELGRRSYDECVALQETLRRRILDGDDDAETLLLVEHDPVVTLGRRADRATELRVSEAELAESGVALVTSSRGGQATYHGPGQLVAYPVMRLRQGVVAHVERLAGAAVATAASVGVRARFRRDCPGAWVDDRKLASIGVHVHRRVAVHGLALNVTRAPLAHFGRIVPCGVKTTVMTSLETERSDGSALDLPRLGRCFAESFAAAHHAAPELVTAVSAIAF